MRSLSYLGLNRIVNIVDNAIGLSEKTAEIADKFSLSG